MTDRNRWAQDLEAGFTLLELIISITLLAMLSVLLFGGLSFGTRVWEKTQTSTTDTNRIRSVQALLAGELSQIYPIFVLASPADRHVEFDGEANAVTFLTPSRTMPGALNWVHIAAEHINGQVVLTENAVPELAVSQSNVAHKILMPGLKSLDFAYFGTWSSDTPAQWNASWKNGPALPALIRVRASFADRNEKWPDLIVTPRVDVDESCVYDALTKYCQGRRK